MARPAPHEPQVSRPAGGIGTRVNVESALSAFQRFPSFGGSSRAVLIM